MNDFTASNGIIVGFIGSSQLWTVDPLASEGAYANLSDAQMQALREFFQAEADERLGRWRWPENPDYVVYLLKQDVVAVVEEKNGTSGTFGRGEYTNSVHGDAAHAYFDAHPEPKPWEQAEAGEIWELKVEGVTRTYASIASSGRHGVYVRFFPTHEVTAVTLGAEAPEISAGRCIWAPGVSS